MVEARHRKGYYSKGAIWYRRERRRLIWGIVGYGLSIVAFFGFFFYMNNAFNEWRNKPREPISAEAEARSACLRRFIADTNAQIVPGPVTVTSRPGGAFLVTVPARLGITDWTMKCVWHINIENVKYGGP